MRKQDQIILKGYERSSVRLLSRRLAELGVAGVSRETVRRTLKKELQPQRKKQWCMGHLNGLFLGRVEHTLGLVCQPHDPAYPLVCVDEKGKELSDTPRGELPIQLGQPAWCDYEWKREGSCNLFVAYEPTRGYRKVVVTTRRQNQDFGGFLKQLVDEVYPQAVRVQIVCDYLNLHTEGCLYDTFEPGEAKRISSRLEFHYMPTHANWLNTVEIEIGILERQALSGRLGSEEAVRERVAAWETERNRSGSRIQWQFDCGQACSKFHRFYRWRE